MQKIETFSEELFVGSQNQIYHSNKNGYNWEDSGPVFSTVVKFFKYKDTIIVSARNDYKDPAGYNYYWNEKSHKWMYFSGLNFQSFTTKNDTLFNILMKESNGL